MNEDFNFLNFLGIGMPQYGKPTGETGFGFNQPQSIDIQPTPPSVGQDLNSPPPPQADVKESKGHGHLYAAGAGLLSAVISNHFGYKVAKAQLQIKKYEQEIGAMKIKGAREAQTRNLFKAKEEAMIKIAAKNKIDQEKMMANTSMAKVKMADKGVGAGGSAGETRQALTQARVKQEQMNQREWSALEENILLKRDGIETEYIYANAANSITPMLDYQSPNYGEASLTMMNNYLKYRGYAG